MKESRQETDRERKRENRGIERERKRNKVKK